MVIITIYTWVTVCCWRDAAQLYRWHGKTLHRAIYHKRERIKNETEKNRLRKKIMQGKGKEQSERIKSETEKNKLRKETMQGKGKEYREREKRGKQEKLN
jgi:hypothetical protein